MPTFAYPHLLWLLLFLPILAWLRGKRGNPHALPFPSTRFAQMLGKKPLLNPQRILISLWLLALAFGIFAMARPQKLNAHHEVESSGIDILLAIDISGSMEAMDFFLNKQRVNRLDVVKKTVATFIKERPNDRIGLTVFGGKSYLLAPLTHDHPFLLKRLEAVETSKQRDGTALGMALAMATDSLESSTARSRIVILLTDGNNNAGKISPLTAAHATKALHIKVYTIGAGSRGNAPIPVGRDPFGRTIYRNVPVDIDEKTLQAIAQETGGMYFRATSTHDLTSIYQEIDKLETTTRHLKDFSSATDLFFYPLSASLLCFLLWALLSRTLYRELPS